MAPSEAPDGQRPPRPQSAPCYRPRAQLLARTFAVDVFACPKCHGRMRLLAMVEDPANIARFPVFHTTLRDSLHSNGKPLSVECPWPVGPRNPGQFQPGPWSRSRPPAEMARASSAQGPNLRWGPLAAHRSEDRELVLAEIRARSAE